MSQDTIRIAQPIIGPEEEAAVIRVLRSGQLAQGRIVSEFEASVAGYTGARHAIAVSSGTAALVIALQAHGIGPGDEVIVPVFTFAATANAVLLVGATPVFVDIDARDYNIDIAAIEPAITRRTKAIMPVHLYGQACNIAAVRQIASTRGLTVIEDACQALGACWEGSRIGSEGTSCFSFYATKGITTGEGGMIVTDDAEVAATSRLLRNQGERVRYTTEVLGFNGRMTEMSAALGLAQMQHIDTWIERRRAHAAWFSDHLPSVATPVEQDAAYHTYQQYTIRVPRDRDGVKAALLAHHIEAAVYYPLCLHQQPLYLQMNLGGVFPAAEQAAREVLSLPVHAALSQRDLERIAAAVASAVEAGGGAK